jgi:hypothetical protein
MLQHIRAYIWIVHLKALLHDAGFCRVPAIWVHAPQVSITIFCQGNRDGILQGSIPAWRFKTVLDPCRFLQVNPIGFFRLQESRTYRTRPTIRRRSHARCRFSRLKSASCERVKLESIRLFIMESVVVHVNIIHGDPIATLTTTLWIPCERNVLQRSIALFNWFEVGYKPKPLCGILMSHIRFVQECFQNPDRSLVNLKIRWLLWYFKQYFQFEVTTFDFQAEELSANAWMESRSLSSACPKLVWTLVVMATPVMQRMHTWLGTSLTTQIA